MHNIEYELNEKIHAIIINPYLTWEDFCTNCDLIKKFNIKNISTSLNYLADFKNSLINYSASINALISYPLADLPISFIEELVCFAKDKGANGIEYIPNFINLYKRNLETFAAEIEQVKLSGLPVSIIINKAKLHEKYLEVDFNDGVNSKLEIDKITSEFSKEDIVIKSIEKTKWDSSLKNIKNFEYQENFYESKEMHDLLVSFY